MPNYINCVETVPIYAPYTVLKVADSLCNKYMWKLLVYKPLCDGVPLVTLSVNPSSRKTACDSQHSSNVKIKYIHDNYLDIT